MRTIYVGYSDGSQTKYRVIAFATDPAGDLLLTLADGRALILAAGEWAYLSEPKKDGGMERQVAAQAVQLR